MEPFSFFTDHQKIVLKKLWIPAIIAAILGVYVNREFYLVMSQYPTMEAYQSMYATIFYLIGFLFAIILAWEQIIKNDWKRTVFIIGGYMATQFIYKKLQSLLGSNSPDGEVFYFAWNCAQIIGVCAIAGKKDFLRTGLFAGALIHSCAFFPVNATFLSFEGYNILAALHGLAVPYLICTWLFIAENTMATDEYKEVLKSKIQLVSKAEYSLLFPVASITTWIIIFNASTLLEDLPKYLHYSEGRITLIWAILYILFCGFALFIAVRMTRNVVISRLMTVGDQGDWLLLLHFIPVINFVAWLVCCDKKNEHHTKEENASFYLGRDTSSLGAAIVTFSILLTLYNIYICLAYGSSLAIFMMLLFVVKLVTYFLVRKGGKNIVILLVVLNVLTAPAALPSRLWGVDVMITILLFSLISYYYLVETFAPALGKKDMNMLPENYAAAYV